MISSLGGGSTIGAMTPGILASGRLHSRNFLVNFKFRTQNPPRPRKPSSAGHLSKKVIAWPCEPKMVAIRRHWSSGSITRIRSTGRILSLDSTTSTMSLQTWTFLKKEGGYSSATATGTVSRTSSGFCRYDSVRLPSASRLLVRRRYDSQILRMLPDTRAGTYWAIKFCIVGHLSPESHLTNETLTQKASDFPRPRRPTHSLHGPVGNSCGERAACARRSDPRKGRQTGILALCRACLGAGTGRPKPRCVCGFVREGPWVG